MDYLTNVLIILVIILALVVFTIRLRKKLLNLWTDVSAKEVLFHKLLLDTTIMFYENKLLLQNNISQYLPLTSIGVSNLPFSISSFKSFMSSPKGEKISSNKMYIHQIIPKIIAIKIPERK